MALSQSSKILVSDINTALAGKQDALGYTPVKSVNGTQADSSGNVAISVSAPVTSVNGMTGAVTISSVSSATACPNVYTFSDKGTIKFPSGGTWRYIYYFSHNTQNYTGYNTGSGSGGSNIYGTSNSYESSGIAIRIA